MPDDLTRPPDYRVLLEACPDLTIVGGQAVNVWAITYLDPEQSHPTGFGSRDLDVLAHAKVTGIIAALPGCRPHGSRALLAQGGSSFEAEGQDQAPPTASESGRIYQ